MERLVGWWREQLDGAPPVLEIPTDRPRPAAPGDRGAVRPFDLDEAQAAPLRALARDEGVTVFMVVLAAWQAVLARWSGHDDVVVGTPVAGRSRTETEGLIGFFANTLVLRTDLSGDPSGRALLARVREVTLGAFAHQDLPFEKLVEELAPERSLSHSPLFQVMFVLGTPRVAAPTLGASEASTFRARATPAKFDLNLQLADVWGRLYGGIEYRT